MSNKRQFKYTFAAIAMGLSLLGSGFLSAGEFGPYTYEIEDDAITITDYLDDVTDPANIPAEIEGLPVTRIGERAFVGCDLTSLIIPASVTSIGDYAFYNCGRMESISFSEGLISIGEGMMWQCYSLVTVTLPASVTSVGPGPFAACSKLSSIGVASASQHYTSLDGVLFSLDLSQLLAYPNGRTASSYAIQDGVTSVADYAFNGCRNLTSVTFPESVTTIGRNAFTSCGLLTSVDLPTSATSIGKECFLYCFKLTSIEIPIGVTTIEPDTFYCCSSLANVTLPDSLTHIGVSAFYNCSALRDITIPEGVESIGDEAFYSCASLTEVAIPASVTIIGEESFFACTSLASAQFYGDAPAMEGNAFGPVAPEFKFTYYSGTNGFSSPNWMGYPSMEMLFTELGPIRSIVPTATAMHVSVQNAPGREIGIAFSNDLSAGSWIDLGNFVSAGDGVRTFTDTNPSRITTPRGFYRAFLRPLGN